MKSKIVFFDFDGVIADSFDVGFEVRKMINPLTTQDTYRRLFDGNINDSVSDVEFQKIHNPDIDFFAEYEPRLMKSPIFPGMKDVIKVTAEKNLLIIVSSTTTDMIKKFLAMHDVDSCFDEIMGNDVHKSKIAKIEMALNKYKVGASDCLFVTDTLGDVKEARHMMVPTIAVTWGYQSKATLEKGSPSYIVDTPQELMDVFTHPLSAN
jgi:phosphoglycolate phosphatase-like HAD superfamily hydrolase